MSDNSDLNKIPEGAKPVDWQALALAAVGRADIIRAQTRPVWHVDDLLNTLREVEEFLDQRADADCDVTGYIPNPEMRLLTKVRAAIARAKDRA